jgi:hypothetical protein
MTAIMHKGIEERWHQMSLLEQLGNIGSEVGRAHCAKGNNESLFRSAVDRALELFDLTLEDPRWKGRTSEILQARDVFCDAVAGGKEYGSTLKDLDAYFFEFAYAARLREGA